MRDLNSDGAIGLDDMPPGMRERADRGPSAPGRQGSPGRQGGRRGQGAPPLHAGSPARPHGPPFCAPRQERRRRRSTPRISKAAAAERVDFATKRFLKRFDANGDGKVSKDEFERFAKERFAMLDLDDDGKITEADLPPRMRGRGILK